MSYRVEVDNETGHKWIVDVKRRRSICSTNGCMSRAQRNHLCAKHLPKDETTSASHRKLRNKRSILRKLPGKRSTTVLPTSTSNLIDVKQLKNILSQFHDRFEHDLDEDTFYHSGEDVVQPIIESSAINTRDDDANSESSIEYDYINPLSAINSSNNQHRHVSIASICLQDEQWHQLELFIKHFSSYASLSNNMNVNSSTTHLLVDDSSSPLRCSFSKKIFQAIARRICVVSTRWIDACLSENSIVDEFPFEIRGDASMSTMHLARQRSPTVSLFPSSISFAIDCLSFQRTLTRHELAELAMLSGATLFDLDQPSTPAIQSDLLLVLADPTADRHQLQNKYQRWHSNIKLLTAGFLLKSIVYQEQQSFADFEL